MDRSSSTRCSCSVTLFPVDLGYAFSLRQELHRVPASGGQRAISQEAAFSALGRAEALGIAHLAGLVAAVDALGVGAGVVATATGSQVDDGLGCLWNGEVGHDVPDLEEARGSGHDVEIAILPDDYALLDSSAHALV